MLPFAVLRGYRGSDLATRTATVASVTCPFTGEELAAVAAINPDVTLIHAQQADHHGNVRLWASSACRRGRGGDIAGPPVDVAAPAYGEDGVAGAGACAAEGRWPWLTATSY